MWSAFAQNDRDWPARFDDLDLFILTWAANIISSTLVWLTLTTVIVLYNRDGCWMGYIRGKDDDNNVTSGKMVGGMKTEAPGQPLYSWQNMIEW